MHAAFIDLVKARRRPALADDPDLFSGAFWSGARAVALGLADRSATPHGAADCFGDNVAFKATGAAGLLAARSVFPVRNAVRFAPVDRLISLTEERQLWRRYGL